MSDPAMKDQVQEKTGLSAPEFDAALQAFIQDPRVAEKMGHMRLFQQEILRELMQ